MTFRDLISGPNGIVTALNTYIVPTIFALIVIAFIWGVANYFIIQGGSDDARAKGHQLVLWGIIGIVAFVALWGFVNLLLSTLGLNS